MIELGRRFNKSAEVRADHPDRQRPELKARISTEALTGVLRELVDGYYRVLARGGFAEPPSAARAKETWLKRANVVASFVNEALILSDAWRLPATEA